MLTGSEFGPVRFDFDSIGSVSVLFSSLTANQPLQLHLSRRDRSRVCDLCVIKVIVQFSTRQDNSSNGSVSTTARKADIKMTIDADNA